MPFILTPLPLPPHPSLFPSQPGEQLRRIDQGLTKIDRDTKQAEKSITQMVRLFTATSPSCSNALSQRLAALSSALFLSGKMLRAVSLPPPASRH